MLIINISGLAILLLFAAFITSGNAVYDSVHKIYYNKTPDHPLNVRLRAILMVPLAFLVAYYTYIDLRFIIMSTVINLAVMASFFWLLFDPLMGLLLTGNWRHEGTTAKTDRYFYDGDPTTKGDFYRVLFGKSFVFIGSVVGYFYLVIG